MGRAVRIIGATHTSPRVGSLPQGACPDVTIRRRGTTSAARAVTVEVVDAHGKGRGANHVARQSNSGTPRDRASDPPGPHGRGGAVRAGDCRLGGRGARLAPLRDAEP